MLMTYLVEHICVLLLLRKMLTKDTKPEEKGVGKESGQVIPLRPETPKLFKAALEVGKGETFAKLKETYKDTGATLQVLALSSYNIYISCIFTISRVSLHMILIVLLKLLYMVHDVSYNLSFPYLHLSAFQQHSSTRAPSLTHSPSITHAAHSHTGRR